MKFTKIISHHRTKKKSNMLARSIQQQDAQETIFSSNNSTSSQLVSSYFSQMSDQFKQLRVGKGNKHYRLLSGNILGQNHIPFQSTDDYTDEDQSEAFREQQRQNRQALLERSFFLYELANEEELDTESDRMSEKLRYFYTHGCECHPNDQLFLVGYIQAFLVFAKNFAPENEEIRVITFLNSQLAFSYFNHGENLLVVCAPISVPTSCLSNLAHRMVQCMSMFHGIQSPYNTSVKNVAQNKERLSDLGYELTALVDRFHDSPVDMFHPLGYIELPPRNNSVFLSGVHLLDELLDNFTDQK
jgi:hypothetical protein